MMWAGVALLAGLVGFVLAALSAGAVGFWATVARGLPAPDMTGGLAPLILALCTAAGSAAQIFNQRHVERRDQTYSGASAALPFDPSPAPGPASGPRPGDSP